MLPRCTANSRAEHVDDFDSEEVRVHPSPMHDAVNTNVGREDLVEDQVLPMNEIAILRLAEPRILRACTPRGKRSETPEVGEEIVDQPDGRPRVVPENVGLNLEEIELCSAEDPNRSLHPRAVRRISTTFASGVPRSPLRTSVSAASRRS